jgi:N utilization substance protein B
LLAQTEKVCYDICFDSRGFMALPRKKFREIVFQLLYSNHFYKIEENDYISVMMKMLKTTKKNIKDAHDVLLKVDENISCIDEKIKKSAIDYKFDRISKIELNILRLSFYEIFFDETIPKKVSISEAIRLCKKFSSSESSKFVNAILDSDKK